MHWKFPMHLPDYVYRFWFLIYKPLKLQLSYEVDEKRWFWASGCLGEGIPQISDMHFQTALTSEHVTGFG